MNRQRRNEKHNTKPRRESGEMDTGRSSCKGQKEKKKKHLFTVHLRGDVNCQILTCHWQIFKKLPVVEKNIS